MGRFDLTDDERSIMAPHFPKHERGTDRKDDRRIFNGIFYILWVLASDECLGQMHKRGGLFQCNFRVIWNHVFKSHLERANGFINRMALKESKSEAQEAVAHWRLRSRCMKSATTWRDLDPVLNSVFGAK